METIVRKARMTDREAIHTAHMRSIREICVIDHGNEEIKGWGYRELGDRWTVGIEKELVWVVDVGGAVQGVASIHFPEESNSAFVQSLYLTPEVLGKGLGKDLLLTMLQEAQKRGVKAISLDSTITAHRFYRQFGFQDSGPRRSRSIGGFPVTSIPMAKNL